MQMLITRQAVLSLCQGGVQAVRSLISRQAVLSLTPRGVQAVQLLITRQAVELVTPLLCEGSPLLELPAGDYFGRVW